MAEQEQRDESHPFHNEGGGIVFDKPKSQEEIANETRDREQHEFARDQVKTNRRLAWFTGLLVVGTFIGTGIGIWQASIAQTAANAARDAAKAAQGALGEQRLARIQSATDAQDARKVSAAESEAADSRNMAALEASAKQSKDSLDASIEASRNDQRAWVSIADIKLAKEPAVAEDIAITFTVANSGKTPATDVSLKYGMDITSGEYPNPDWSKVTPGNREGIFPNTSIRQTAIKVAGASITEAIVSAYKSHLSRLYVRMHVDYRDVFDKPHWSEVCVIHLFGESVDYFEGCAVGVTIDPMSTIKH